MVSTVQTKSTVLGWGIALVGALFLNIFLFGLMPGLIQQIPAPPDRLDDLKNIQVIRIKKQASPLRKKTPRKIIKPTPLEPVKQMPATRVAPLKKIDIRPWLQFELNPELPAVSMDLAMPSLEHFSMEMPTLETVYDLSELDTGLTALVKIPPIYPSRAKKRGIEGVVTVEFMVTKQGLVQELKITRAEPENIFNKAVINCVSRWKFKSPTVEGLPVTAWARTTIKFQLEDE